MENLETAIAQIKQELPGLRLLENEPMSAHSSFKIGGPARALAVPADVSSLSKICHILKMNKLAPMLLGNGTNILFPDEGLPELFIISTEKLTKLFTGMLDSEAPTDLSRSSMGIGLSVCSAIIKAHGGDIWARRRPTGGTEVGFRLEMEDHHGEQQV